MTTDTKAVAARFYEILNTRNPERVDEVCAPDVRGHAGAGTDLTQLKESLSTFLQAFPDLSWEVRHLICEDDTVSAWLTYTGTHEAEFAGVPGTGRPIKIAGWDLIRVDGGQIVEITQYCDLFTLMNQIGALPTTAPA